MERNMNVTKKSKKLTMKKVGRSSIVSSTPNTAENTLDTNVKKVCDLLLSLKNEHNAINSKYLKSIREVEDYIIPALVNNSYTSKLGSVSAYDRMFVNITEDDYEVIRKYCQKNKLNVDDFIDIKIMYKATPRFKKLILSSPDFDMPFLDSIKKIKHTYLKVRLAL